MRKIVRLTENELHNIVAESVRRIMREDVLGNDWNVNDTDDLNNNYEPFEDQLDDDDESHDYGIVGDKGIDDTIYY